MANPVNQLETLINRANEYYYDHSIAEVFKIDPPRNRTQKKRCDYMGAVNATPIMLEAKEINQDALPMGKIHLDQMGTLIYCKRRGWLAALAIHLQPLKRFWIVPITEEFLGEHWYPRHKIGLEGLQRHGTEVFLTHIKGMKHDFLNWVTAFQDDFDRNLALWGIMGKPKVGDDPSDDAFGNPAYDTPENQWFRK